MSGDPRESAGQVWPSTPRSVRSGDGSGPPIDRGAVTVEAAIGITSIVIVLAAALSAIASLIVTLRVTDAAGEAARLAARGDLAGAQAAVARLAPAGARL